MRQVPPIVAQLTPGFEAWVVGSAATPGIDLAKVRDFDILVPYAHWVGAAMLIPADAKPNTLGGWKFSVVMNGYQIVIDVWPGDLGWLMTNDMAKAAWHPRSGTRLFKVEEGK